MPRNKRPQDREEKHAEIVAAASKLFIDDGYEATSMGQIAATAGVAANTIYWYFRDKDDVLIAVLNKVVGDSMREYRTISPRGLAARTAWFVERLEQLAKLVSTVHARVHVSESINDWHNMFHARSEAVLRLELLEAGGSTAETEAWVKIWIFTIEGLLVHPFTAMQKNAIYQALENNFKRVG
ncbi:MAG: TetR/AcrR family transcriptional regulator [Mycobacteriaceae bacterium]